MDHPSLNFKGQSFQADRNVIPRYWDFPVIVVQSLSCVWLFATHGLQHARLPCPSLSPEVCSDSCPLSWWCYPTISSSAALFSFCLQSSPASKSFPMSQLFMWGGQSSGASASMSVLELHIRIVVLEKTLGSPLDCKEIKPVKISTMNIIEIEYIQNKIDIL